MSAKKAAAWNFLAGGGELGKLIRAKDWSQTPVGPPDQWPQSLRTTVSTCLNAQLPILIWWGPERVMIYNDAYRLLLGDKHPHALGGQGRDVWPESWDTLGPKLDGVSTRGEADWSENQVLTVNGQVPEETRFNYSYSPIYDESDGIGGIFCVATETNDTRLARQELDQAGPENRRTQPPAETNERLLNAVIQRMPLGIGIFSGADNVVELVNPVVQAMWGRSTGQVLGKPLWEVAPEMVEQGFAALLAGVRQTGRPFTGNELPAVLNRNGQADLLYFDFSYEPLPEPDGRIERVLVVATEVTGARETRLLVEENDSRLELIFEQVPVAMTILGPGPDLVYELANPYYCELIGRPASQLVGKPLWEAIPEAAGQILDGISLAEVLTQVAVTVSIPPYLLTHPIRYDH